MSPLVLARASHAGLTLSAASAAITAYWQPAWAVFGLAGAVTLWRIGRSYQRAHQTVAKARAEVTRNTDPEEQP